MKSFAILIVGIVLGYVLFAYLSPSEPYTVRTTRTITQTNTVPVKVTETRYHAPDAENAPAKAEPAKISIKIDPVTEEKINIIHKSETLKMKERFVLGKHKDDFGFKTFLGFNQVAFLAANDVRIKKMYGLYSGSLKFYKKTRTGESEKITMSINPEETSVVVHDAYDNPNENYSLTRNSSEIFRTIPGDENLLMLVMSEEYSLVFDFRTFPDLKGKAYQLNLVVGEFELKKKQDKK